MLLKSRVILAGITGGRGRTGRLINVTPLSLLLQVSFGDAAGASVGGGGGGGELILLIFFFFFCT